MNYASDVRSPSKAPFDELEYIMPLEQSLPQVAYRIKYDPESLTHAAAQPKVPPP